MSARKSNQSEHDARERVRTNPELQKYEKIIFYDWPNWDEHIAWVNHASLREIVSWASRIAEDESTEKELQDEKKLTFPRVRDVRDN